MSNSYTVRRAVSLALLTGGAALLHAPFVSAQEQSASATADAPLEEVVITGSLIKRPNAETAEAITVLQADDLKKQGVVTLEQALNLLTSSVTATNVASSVGSFSGGGTYANLRNLGNGRTLILLDGQRLANNANSGNAVDLSGIPISAIASVEVLREGASALYGSDAIAGVINFITKKNFQGAEVQANFDQPQKSPGSSGSVEATFGHGDLADNGYHVMITGSYSRQQEIRATDRGFSASGFNSAGGVLNTNFPGNFPGVVKDSNGNFFQYGYPACAGNPFLTTELGDCAYRYSAATDLIPKASVASGLVSLTKSLPGNNNLQLQYFYTRSKITAYSGPNFYDFVVDPTSPYYPSASQLTCDGDCGGLAPDLDPTHTIEGEFSDPDNERLQGNVNTEQRVLLSFTGNNAGWDYTANLNYSRNKNDNLAQGGIPNVDVFAPGGVYSNLINPFGPQSAAGRALIDSSYVNGSYALGTDKRWSVDGHASHELGDAFNSGTPATVALGFDVGGERFEYATTPLNELITAATGLTASTAVGSRRTQAAFFEVDVPITQKLDVDVSDREDRYSDFGRTNNAKVSVRYQPTSFLTFRGTASTGFRAPTLFNLYSSNYLAASSGGTIGAGNPFCKPGAYNAEFSPATCISQGIALRGGNPNLTPETSQNFDLGVIISPIENMGITIDYFRVLLKNTIGTIPTSAIYHDPTKFANLYVLDNNGTLSSTISEALNCTPYTAPTCGYILRTSQNTGRITTDGIDLSIQYVQRTPIGTFHEDLEGTAITQFRQQQYDGGPLINLAGWLQIDGSPPAYKWQHNLRVDWTSPGGIWGGGISNRFYAHYIDELPDGNGNQRTVGNYSLFDAYASVKPIEKLTVLFGIKNLLNKDPPFTNAYQDTFAAGYNAFNSDVLLRNFYVNLKYTIY